LPAFNSKNPALAEQLPEIEKAIIFVEKEARLIQAFKSDAILPT
jgi:hypothetical protein